MIQVLQINKSYGRQQVLKNVCVSFSQGLIHGIVGRNGSGKTQLFKVICGYVLPDSGEVQVAGQRIGKDRRFPEKMGLLIESPGFLPGYSSLFNLQMLAAMNTRLNKQNLLSLLHQAGLLDAAHKKVGKYSLGMRQRLGLAQALMGKPRLLILDEPFNGLDKRGVEEVRSLLLGLKQEGVTILLARHNPDDIRLLCDTVHEMDAGVLSTVPRPTPDRNGASSSCLR
jgi:ABC-2 type transport system ATP-binding protein